MVPKTSSEYMGKEIARVSLVRQLLMTCGRKELVVHTAAIRPMRVTNCIQYGFCFALIMHRMDAIKA